MDLPGGVGEHPPTPYHLLSIHPQTELISHHFSFKVCQLSWLLDWPIIAKFQDFKPASEESTLKISRRAFESTAGRKNSSCKFSRPPVWHTLNSSHALKNIEILKYFEQLSCLLTAKWLPLLWNSLKNCFQDLFLTALNIFPRPCGFGLLQILVGSVLTSFKFKFKFHYCWLWLASKF